MTEIVTVIEAITAGYEIDKLKEICKDFEVLFKSQSGLNMVYYIYEKDGNH